MPYKYSCFVSYCHGKEDLVKTFIDELKNALKRHIDPYLDEEIYIDEERLRGGDLYTEHLAQAICQSICMIVVYMPKYERHTYCLREFAAMEELEKKRLHVNCTNDLKRGLIIPIIFRGVEDLPPNIRDKRQYYDFSKFTLISPRISENPEYVPMIEEIARTIYDFYKILNSVAETSDEDPCGGCSSFTLPLADHIPPWRGQIKPPISPFPWRTKVS